MTKQRHALAHAVLHERLPLVDLKARDAVAREWRRLLRLIEHKRTPRTARMAIVEETL